jgi:hypothetical protein
VYHNFLRVFTALPYSAVLDDESLCCSGGIGPGITDLSILREFKKPSNSFSSANMADLVLSDPTDALPMFLPNTRGLGGLFGLQSALTFLKKVKLSRIIRGRQKNRNGFEWSLEGHVLTLFSASEINPVEGPLASAWCVVIERNTDFRLESRPALATIKRNEVGFISSESTTSVVLRDANAMIGSSFLRVTGEHSAKNVPSGIGSLAVKRLNKLNMTQPLPGRRMSASVKPAFIASRMVLQMPTLGQFD